MIDLKRDCQGLFQLEDNKIELRDAIRRYFRQRNEDSIDLI
jgi:flagellar basal body-associated protein FliL